MGRTLPYRFLWRSAWATLFTAAWMSGAIAQEIGLSPAPPEMMEPPALLRLPAERNCIEKPEAERKACEKELFVFELGCMNHCWDTCRGSAGRNSSSCYPLCMESCRRNGFIEGPSDIGLQESCPPLQGLLGQLKAATEFQLCGLPCKVDPGKGLIMNTPQGFVCTITPAGRDPLGRSCLSIHCQKKF